MALNTQLGYQKPRTGGVYATPKPPRPATGVTRALAGVQPAPARPSFADPYADPSGSIFQQPQYPTVQSQAPAGTPSTYTAQRPAAPAAPAGYSFDLETDPILQQMHAMAAKQRTEAEASALAQRKQLAIQYGDQGYGSGIDQATGQAAAGNPFSVTANLANQYQTGTQNLDEQLNAHNLFYSGARIHDLAAALKDYQQQQANAASAFQTALGGVNQNRIAALMGADQSEQGAYQDAYARALQLALANGGGGQPLAPADYTNPSAQYLGTNTIPDPYGGPGTVQVPHYYEGALPQSYPSDTPDATRRLAAYLGGAAGGGGQYRVV